MHRQRSFLLGQRPLTAREDSIPYPMVHTGHTMGVLPPLRKFPSFDFAFERLPEKLEVVDMREKRLATVSTGSTHAGPDGLDGTVREDGAEYPTGLRLALIIIALSLAVFLTALDNSIIATAIPKITDQFNSLPDVGWYGSCMLPSTPFCNIR